MFVRGRIVAVPRFLVFVRQAGPQFDPARPLEEQSGWDEHAAFMDALVAEGRIVLGGTLPNLRTAHAIEAEAEVRAIWARDPWHESHLLLESVEPWTIRLAERFYDPQVGTIRLDGRSS